MALSPALRKSVSEAKNKYGRSDGKRIRPKEGRNVYRILAPTKTTAPWVGESGKFWADLGTHWIKAEKNGKPLAVVGSRDVCYQEPCPVGTAIDLAISKYAHDEQTKGIFEEWKVSKNVLFNAIDRSSDAEAQEIEILEVRPTVAQQIFDLMEQYDDEGMDITDLSAGVDIVVTRSGKGLNTEYTVNVKPGVSKPVAKDALSKCHDLHEHIAKEFFRGDETKALNAIGQIAGIPQAQLVAIAGGAASGNTAALMAAGSTAGAEAAARTPAAALTSSAAAVEGAVQTAVDEISDAELDAAVAAVEDPAPAAATPAAAPAQAELSSAEVDDVLAELDGLIV